MIEADEFYAPNSPETIRQYKYAEEVNSINTNKRKSKPISDIIEPAEKQICIYGNQYNLLKAMNKNDIFSYSSSSLATLKYEPNENIFIDTKNKNGLDCIEKENVSIIPSITERIFIKYHFDLHRVP